jgi:RNA polymerase sigma-70 factor (ECF subfamily)
VFARRKGYEPRGKFSTFLWRVALNLCYDELRKRERRHETALDANCEEDGASFATDELPPDVALVRGEAAERVRMALMKIPETYRSVLILRHYEDLKFREIGAVLGIPEGTVKSRMAEGLSRLGRLLQEGTETRDVAPDPNRNLRSGAESGSRIAIGSEGADGRKELLVL